MIKKHYKYLLASGGLAIIVIPPLFLTTLLKNNYDNQFNTNISKEENNNLEYWELAGTDEHFASLTALDNYVKENYIKKIPAQIYLDQPFLSLNDKNYDQQFFSAIPLNSVVPLVVNSQTDQGINLDQNMAYVYKGYDDMPYFTSDLSIKGITEIEEAAKRSWMEIHQAYLFDDIYFANIYDLQSYLRLAYQNQSLVGKPKNYQLILDTLLGEQSFKESFPIVPFENEKGAQILPASEANSNQTSLEDLTKIVQNNILNNSKLMLEVNDPSTNNKEIIPFDDSINSLQLGTLQQNLNYWNIGAQNGNSFYIVDNQKGSRGDLFGEYFLESPTDLGYSYNQGVVKTGIMDINNSWSRIDQSYAQSQIIQNYDLNAKVIGSLMSMALNRFKEKDLSNDLTNNLGTNAEISIEDLLNHAENYANYHQNFEGDTSFFSTYNIDLENKDFFTYLNSISDANSSYSYLGDELKTISANLINGKRYNAFYLLPVLRNYLISRLLANQVSQKILSTVNQVFIALADMISIEINILLKPLFIDLNNVDLYNGVDLAKIYSFDNVHSSIYNNPRTALDIAFENGGLQGQITKAQVLIFGALTSIINQQIVDILYLTTNKKQIKAKVEIDQTSINSLFTQINSFVTSVEYKSQLYNQSKNFINAVNSQYQPLNIEIANYQNNYDENILYWMAIEDSFDQLEDNQAKTKWLTGALTMSKSAQIIADLAINTPFYLPNSETTQEEEIDIIGFILTDGSEMIDSISSKLDILKSIDESKIIDKGVEALNSFLDAAKTLKKLTDTIETFLALVPWVSNILSIFSLVIDIIDFFKRSYNEVYYSYRSPNQQEIIWNGGEEATQFWQTWPTFTLDDLVLNNPLQISVSHNNLNTNSGGDASNFYFDGMFYDSPTLAFYDAYKKLLKKANLKLTSSEKLTEFNELVQSLFNNAQVFYYYPFALPGNDNGMYWSFDENYNDTTLEDLTNRILFGKSREGEDLSEFSQIAPVLVAKNSNDKINWYINQNNSPYLESIWTTSLGNTNSYDFFIEDYIKQISNNIKPVYILQVPEMTSDQELIKHQYHLPYPYYDFGSKQIIKKDDQDNLELYQKIYNPNVQASYQDHLINGQIEEIVDFLITNWGYKMFDVPYKKATIQSVLQADNFANIEEKTVISDVYESINLEGQIRYYWNISGALNWLKSSQNLNAQFINKNLNQYLEAQAIELLVTNTWLRKEKQYA